MNPKKNDTLLLPSMMCADFGHLQEEILSLEGAGADGFHLDLMDGNYVPNYGMGLQDIELIATRASLPCDIHMMVENPKRYIERFAGMGIKVIYVHPESDQDCASTLEAIRDLGVAPGIAINPATQVESIEGFLPLVDHVLVMTVNPGFAGQRWIPEVDQKIERLAALGRKFGFDVIVDGNCSPENIERAYGFGARGFVLGTAGLFGHGPYRESIARLRTICGGAPLVA